MKPKILSLGGMYVDINCYDFPYGAGLLPNKEVVGEQYEVALGGSALIFARLSSALDLKPVFIGKIGQDKMGKVLTELALDSGIVPAFIESADTSTYVGMNFIGPDDSSIMAVAGTAGRTLTFEEVKKKFEEHVDDISYLYLGGCYKLLSLLPDFHRLAERAKERGVKVILDHGRVTNLVTEKEMQIIRDLIPLVDYYLPDKTEFLTTWNADSIEEALKKVEKISQAQIVVKDSANGAVGYQENKIIKIPAFPVDVINTVGAGDSFNAGFIKARDLGLDFEKSIRFGCATAAIKISQKGLPSLETIEKLLARQNDGS